MKHPYTRRMLLGLIFTLPVFAVGCGGGNSSTSLGTNGNGTRGTLELRLNFSTTQTREAVDPSSFAGNIPIGTRSIRVAVTNPTTNAQLADPRLITVPTTPAAIQPVTINYPLLPAGPVRVSAMALPNTDGTGNPIGEGAATGQINSLETTNLTVPFGLTIRSGAVSPASLTVSPVVGSSTHTATVTATFADSASNALRYPVYWVSRDPKIATVTQDTANPDRATITGLVEGNTEVSVVEPNSGTIRRTQVFVRFQSPGGQGNL